MSGNSGLYSALISGNSEGEAQCLAPLSRAGVASGLMSSDPLLRSFTFRMERDAAFTQKKAERACLRVHLREKYRLPKVRLLTQQTCSHFYIRNAECWIISKGHTQKSVCVYV